jgi:hypothetical protein
MNKNLFGDVGTYHGIDVIFKKAQNVGGQGGEQMSKITVNLPTHSLRANCVHPEIPGPRCSVYLNLTLH